jgi:hypothetical protein
MFKCPTNYRYQNNCHKIVSHYAQDNSGDQVVGNNVTELYINVNSLCLRFKCSLDVTNIRQYMNGIKSFDEVTW